MLREDVVEAVRQGKFNIYAVDQIDDGIEILTGVKAGKRGPDGKFEPGTINAMVEDKLQAFAERAKSFGRQNGGNTSDGNSVS
jgi:predicted ATP-dependent protease